MKKVAWLLLFSLQSLSLLSQEISEPTLFISDHTSDKILNDRDVLIVHLDSINWLIEKEEWRLQDIDLSINDFSLKELVPRRIARTVTIEVDGETRTVDSNLLAFTIDKSLLPVEVLSGLRRILKDKMVFMDLSLPDDATYNGKVKVTLLEESKARRTWSFVAVGAIALVLFYFAFYSSMLKDKLSAAPAPPPSIPANPSYSFSRAQIWLWTLITMTSIAYIWIATGSFAINDTVWILLGIGGATVVAGTVIDNKDNPLGEIGFM